MSNELRTSDLLSRLRHVSNECLRTDYGYANYQAFKAELNAERVLALVECAEAMKEVRDSIDYDLSCSCNQCAALKKVLAAIAKLEAL